MLTGFLVLVLSRELGLMCGKILGDLGAEVIKVERPGGDRARKLGPFYKGMVHPERSLSWYALNTNKKGITLDLESRDGRELMRRLLEKADCLIESFPVGHMKKLGLDSDLLRKINKRLIMTSISPFGQDGPYAGYSASDLVCMAMGGFLYLCGEPDRPPVGVSLPHAYFFGGADGAAATMIAYYYREKSGEGQWVDVSIQQSVALTSFNSVPWWQLEKTVQKRNAPFRKVGLAGGLNLRQTWRCKDGFVVFILTAGAFGAKTNKSLTEWMKEEGMAPDFMKEMDWETFDASKLTSEFIEDFDEHVGKFFLTHTMAELYDGAFQRGMQLYPVSDCKALAENKQLRAREYWEQVEHPDLGDSIIYPGGWVKMSEGECRIRYPAPKIGEHNREIYQGMLGLSEKDVSTLMQAGIIYGRFFMEEKSGKKEALDDLKVIDFGWAIAAPTLCWFLATHGATVIRVETSKRPDVYRVSAPYKDQKPGLNRAGFFAYPNVNKLSIALDLGLSEAVEVPRRLVKWADVVVDNFRVGPMEKWGLGYEDLKKM